MARCGPTRQSWRICKHCNECRARKVLDISGRALAEQQNPALLQSASVTVTYANNPEGDAPLGAVTLQYSHISTLIQRLKDAAYSDGPRYNSKNKLLRVKRTVRFFCAGEYGSKKQRAHYHLILYIYDDKIEFPPFNVMSDWKYWPHGKVFFQPLDIGTARYQLKYALKPPSGEDGYGYSKRVNISRYPPLGHDFFQKLADDYVKQRLAVHDGTYQIPGVITRGGKRITFWMTNATLRLFLERYVERWAECYNSIPPRTDFLLENYFDKLAKLEMEADPVRLEKHLAAKKRRDPLLRSNSETVKVPKVEYCFRKHIGTLLFPADAFTLAGVALAYSDGTISVDVDGLPAKSVNVRDRAFGLAVFDIGLSPARAAELVQWAAKIAPRLDPVGARYPLIDLQHLNRSRI